MSYLASYSKKYVLKVKIFSLCVYPFTKMAVKLSDLRWSCKSPTFNLHQLQKISTVFKIAVLTPEPGITVLF